MENTQSSENTQIAGVTPEPTPELTPTPVQETATAVSAPSPAPEVAAIGTPAPSPAPEVMAQAVPEVAATPEVTPVLQANGAPVYVQVPLWRNPRILFAAVAAIVIVAAGVFFSQSSKGLKGSFDQYDPAVDYKIASFAVTQPTDGSLQLAYKIDKKATNLFMAVTKPAPDDLPENDEMVKLIALSDADLEAGEHSVAITADDAQSSFLTTGIYRFQIIAYNENDEITDFKAGKYTLIVENGKVTLGGEVK